MGKNKKLLGIIIGVFVICLVMGIGIGFAAGKIIKSVQLNASDKEVEVTRTIDAEVVNKNPEVETEKVEVELEKITIEKLAYYGMETYECQALNQDDIHYVGLDQFIEITNHMNTIIKSIEEISEDNFDFDNNTLSLTYLADSKSMRMSFDYEYTSDYFNVKNKKIEGQDKKIEISLEDAFFHMVKINDEVYIPLEFIRNEIFGTDTYLIRKDDKKYEFYGFSTYGKLLDGDIRPSDVIEGGQADYLYSLEALNHYLGADIELPDKVNSYSENFFETFKILDKTKDYHTNLIDVSLVTGEFLEKAGFYDYYEISFEAEFSAYFNGAERSEENITFEWINDHTLLVDIDSFGADTNEFRSQTNKVVAALRKMEDKEEKNIVFDVRHNGGGYFRNAAYMMNEILGEGYSVQAEYIVRDEVLATLSYDFERYRPDENKYNVVVLNNEACASATLLFTSILNDYADAVVIGREPGYKQAEKVTVFQTLDGTIYTTTSPEYRVVTKDGIRLDDATLLDIEMTDEKIEEYIKGL